MGGFRLCGPIGCLGGSSAKPGAANPKLHSLTITPMGGLKVDLFYLAQQGGYKKPVSVGGNVSEQNGKPTVGLSNIELRNKPVPGTPNNGRPVHKSNMANITLRTPVLSLDPKSKRISGTAELAIDDTNYPKSKVGGTKLRLFVETDPPELKFGKMPSPGLTGSAELGPAQIKFKLKLKYDAGTLLQNGFNTGTLKKLTEPGFDVSGVLQFAIIKNIPVLNKVLRTKFSASSPSTAALKNPLSDAPTKFALKYRASGLIPVPPGAILGTTSLGYGLTGANWNESRGFSYTVGVLGLPSLPNIVSEISTYLYLDGYYVKRLSDGWEFSVRLTVAAEKVFGGAKTDSQNDMELWRQMNHKAWLPASPDNPAPKDEKPLFLGKVGFKYVFDGI